MNNVADYNYHVINLVKVRRETIVFLEKNRYNPSLKLARDIAVVFGVAIEDVFLFD